MNKLFLTFLNSIESKYHISIKKDWEEFNSEPIKVESEPIKVESEPIKVESNQVFYCIYEYIKKPRKGEVCGVKIKCGEYCSKHIKKEKKAKLEPKLEAKLEEKKITIILNKRLGKFIHSPSKLAFYSKENRVVYGK